MATARFIMSSTVGCRDARFLYRGGRVDRCYARNLRVLLIDHDLATIKQ
jgi:hypothetical protein